MDHAIEIRGLGKRYRGFALSDVSFVVPRGYIMGLIGPNGAGKTTIIKLIMNLIRRDTGEIRIFGLDNLRHEAELKARIGFVYDTPCFHHDVNLTTIASAVAPFYTRWDEKRFRQLMDEFGLDPGRKFKKLSHGMQLQFALAVALSHEAELILMDEPTAGLDPVFRGELLKKLSAIIQDEGRSVLFSTHITSDLEKVADFITYVRAGELVFSANKDEVLENWRLVKGGHELLTDERRPWLRGWRETPLGVEALVDNVEQTRELAAAGAVVDRATLEDIMFYTEKGGHRA